MSEAVLRTRRWTRREYERLIGLDVLHEDDPIELVAGRLIVAEPQHGPHATAIELATEVLRLAFGAGWRIRVQLPLALGASSEPEPDLAIVRGTPGDGRAHHPTTAGLVVEIADRSVRLDRGLKARVYARAGIADYWIVHLVDRTVEVYRDPTREGQRSWRYRAVSIAATDERVVPLAAPFSSILVAHLLP